LGSGNKRHKTDIASKDASEYSRYEYRQFLEKQSRDELIGILMMQKDEKIPVSIFNNSLGPLEALVKYLREEKNYTTIAISRELNRDNRTIWSTYNNVKDKKIKIDYSQYIIPLSVFLKKDLSILESLVHHLKIFHSLTYHQIAVLIGRDDRTIWTVYDRAERKLKRRG
jgi:hypothetical protein